MRSSLLYLRNLEVSVLNERGLRCFLGLVSTLGVSTGFAFTSALTGAFTGVLAAALLTILVVALTGVATGSFLPFRYSSYSRF